jgi:hypothetical protein
MTLIVYYLTGSGQIDTPNGRKSLHDSLINKEAAYVEALKKLEALKSEHPEYKDVSVALTQSNLSDFKKAIEAFAEAIAGRSG